jgi:hypothetical protein
MSTTLEGTVDHILDDFETWFIQSLGNESLSRPERAAVKTFCWYLTHGRGPASLDQLRAHFVVEPEARGAEARASATGG